MTGITKTGIAIDREFHATPEALFAAWTTPGHFARWFGGPDVQVPLEHLAFDATTGRPWNARMVLPDGNHIEWAGDFVEVVPPRRLVFSITDRPASPERANIVVEFRAHRDLTSMHFAQETPGFTPEQQQAVLNGWQSFIDEIEAIVDSDKPEL